MSIDLQKLAAAKRQSLTERKEDVKKRIFKIEQDLLNPGGQVLAQREIETMKQTVLAKALMDHDLGRIDEKELGRIKEEVYGREFATESSPLLLKGLRDELRVIDAEERNFSFTENDVREYLGLKARFNPYHKNEFQALARGLSKALGQDVVKDAEEFLKQQGAKPKR